MFLRSSKKHVSRGLHNNERCCTRQCWVMSPSLQDPFGPRLRQFIPVSMGSCFRSTKRPGSVAAEWDVVPSQITPLIFSSGLTVHHGTHLILLCGMHCYDVLPKNTVTLAVPEALHPTSNVLSPSTQRANAPTPPPPHPRRPMLFFAFKKVDYANFPLTLGRFPFISRSG